jgi:hypothetical protein
MTDDVDPQALRLTILALSISLEEALKVLADKAGGQHDQWLEEAQDLALLRVRAHLLDIVDAESHEKANAALAIAEFIFRRSRSLSPGASRGPAKS